MSVHLAMVYDIRARETVFRPFGLNPKSEAAGSQKAEGLSTWRIRAESSDKIVLHFTFIDRNAEYQRVVEVR